MHKLINLNHKFLLEHVFCQKVGKLMAHILKTAVVNKWQSDMLAVNRSTKLAKNDIC